MTYMWGSKPEFPVEFPMNLLRCNSTFPLLLPRMNHVGFGLPHDISYLSNPLNFFTIPFSMSRQPHGALSSGPDTTQSAQLDPCSLPVTPCRSQRSVLLRPIFFSSEKVMSGIPIIKMSMRSHDIQMILNSLVFASICKSVLLVLSESPEQHCDFSGLDRVLSDFTGDSPSKLRLRDARKRPTKA